MLPFGSTAILDAVAAVLVCGFGSEEWREREACSAAAAECEWAQPWLLAARGSPDIEVARRAERLTADHAARMELHLVRLLTPEGFDRWPYLDWSLGPTSLMDGIVQEAGVWGKMSLLPDRADPSNWPVYREASRRYVIDALHLGHSFAGLREQMTRGAMKELEYLRTKKMPK